MHAQKKLLANFFWGKFYPIFMKTYCRHQKNLVIHFIFKEILRLKILSKKTDFNSRRYTDFYAKTRKKCL